MNLKISNKDEEAKAQRHTQVTQGQVNGSEGSLKILKTPKQLLFSPCHTNRWEGGGMSPGCCQGDLTYREEPPVVGAALKVNCWMR